jgi:hypothetical protein
MRTSHCTIRPVVHAAGPEWAVYCDGTYMDQFTNLRDARRLALAGSADSGVYKTVLQVMSVADTPLAIETLSSPARAGAA